MSSTLYAELAQFSEFNNQSGGAQKNGLSDVFFDFNVKPRVDGEFEIIGNSKLYGGFSYAYTSSLNHDPSGFTRHGFHANATRESDFTHPGSYNDYRYKNDTEDLFLGWKSGKLLDGDENITVDISGGRQKFNIGTGFLISYGAVNGGNRGGGYTWPRTSFDNTIIGRININQARLEGFYLETRPLNPADRRHYTGLNVESQPLDLFKLGFSYINTTNTRSVHDEGSDVSLGIQSINNDTYDTRLEFSPLKNLNVISEYAYQVNSVNFDTKSVRHASGGFGLLEYKLSDWLFDPVLSYRYAVQSEHFDAMSPGATKWGTWFQGEITGMWILYNTNLITHMGKLTLNVSDKVTTNLMYLNFTFVDPSVFNQTAAHFGNELNLITEWQYSNEVKLTASVAGLIPEKGAKQYMGGDANNIWLQTMLYVAFAY